MNKGGNGNDTNQAADRGGETVRRRIGRRAGQRLLPALCLSICLLTGCSLAREEVPAREEDRLAGFLITEQHLHSGTPELKMGPDGKVAFVEEDVKIPGIVLYDQSGRPDGVAFEGIEGYALCDLKVWEEESGIYAGYIMGDEIFSDVHWVSGDTDSAEATVYVEQGRSGCYYFNPIYQTTAGEVYLLPGTGLASGTGMSGETMSHSMSWERTFRKGEEEKKEGSSYTLHITYADLPGAQELLFYREDGSILGSMGNEELTELWAAELWELKVPPEAAWLVLEQEESGGETGRTFCNRGEGRLEFLESGENGYLVKRSVNLQWE